MGKWKKDNRFFSETYAYAGKDPRDKRPYRSIYKVIDKDNKEYYKISEQQNIYDKGKKPSFFSFKGRETKDLKKIYSNKQDAVKDATTKPPSKF